jgi:hypothetical protein
MQYLRDRWVSMSPHTGIHTTAGQNCRVRCVCTDAVGTEPLCFLRCRGCGIICWPKPEAVTVLSDLAYKSRWSHAAEPNVLASSDVLVPSFADIQQLKQSSPSHCRSSHSSTTAAPQRSHTVSIPKMLGRLAQREACYSHHCCCS